MTKFLEKYSQTKAGKRVMKVVIAVTLLPAIILWAIVQDLLKAQPKHFSAYE